MYRYLLCFLVMFSLIFTVTAQDATLEPIVIDDFEVEELFTARDQYNNDIGYIPFGDTAGNVTLRLANSLVNGQSTTTLFMNYAISDFGGFSHVFTDSEERSPQDWSGHNAISFWWLGTNSGSQIQFEIFDNLNLDSTGDTAERWIYRFEDDSRNWKYLEIPFRDFQRNTTWQPAGAPNDGLNLDVVTGYAITLPTGEGRANIDDIQIRVVELPELNEDGIEVEAETVTSIEIDESITWVSREWELLWSDEFELEAGASINEDYWSCEVGGWGWGNNEAEFYTCRPENVSHDGNGNLVITAIQENLEGSECWYGSCTHTSARIITQDKVEFTYGRVEARIRIPEGQGLWPAFWMLGADFPEIGWPESGEIDIMENVGSEPRTVHGTIHGPGYSGGSGIGNSLTVDQPLADDFHIYAIDWDPYVIRWYIDGELYGTLSINDIRGNRWVYDHDFFILLNVAVGGNLPGYPPPSTEFPQQMLIDYVRVYQLVE